MKDNPMINMYGDKIKGVLLEGKVDSSVGGPFTMEPPKDVRKKKLLKVGDSTTKVPLKMYDLIG